MPDDSLSRYSRGERSDVDRPRSPRSARMHELSAHDEEATGGGAVDDLLYVWHAIRRSKWLVLSLFLLGAGAALAYSLVVPPTYQSYSSTLVNTDKAPSAAGRTQDLLEETLSMRRSSRTIENELERLRQSIPLAEKVVDRLGGDTLAAEAGFEGTPTRRQLAQYLMRKRVGFAQAGEKVDIINIVATAPEPQRAARIASVYADEYHEHSREVNQSGARASRSFLTGQVDKRKEDLEQAEEELRQFMEANDAVALDAKSESAVDQIASLDARLEEMRAELEAERQALSELRSQIEDIEPNVLQRVRSSAGSEIEALQQKIGQLETQASDYYGQNPELYNNPEQNPELASIERRLEDARAKVDSLSRQHVDEVMAAGGASGGTTRGGGEGSTQGLSYISELKREALQKSVNIGGLETRVAALENQVGRYEDQMSTLPRRSVQLAQLRREQQSAEQMYLSLQQKLQEASVAEESQIGYVEVIRPALVPGAPVAPNTLLNLLLGGLLGLALGAGVALARQAASGQLRTPSDVEELGFSLLGLIPERKPQDTQRLRQQAATAGNGQRRLLLGTSAGEAANGNAQRGSAQHGSGQRGDGRRRQDRRPPSPFLATLLSTEMEAFRHIRTNLRFGQSQASPQVVAVTSPRMGEGKTSVALGLSRVVAQSGQRVLLIDADLRRPAGHRYLNVSRENGLTDVLHGGSVPSDWSTFRLTAASSQGTPPEETPRGDGAQSRPENPAPSSSLPQREGAVYFLPAGRPMRDASELLESGAMHVLLEEAREEFDMVIIDTPPLLTVTDPVLTSTYCDATLMVAAAGQTDRESLLQARQRLESIRATAPLAGVVLNRVDADDGDMSAYGYDYGYGYGDGYDEDGYGEDGYGEATVAGEEDARRRPAEPA